MSLLAAYNFDELSGDFLDSSGNGRSWAPNNNAVRVTGGHTGGGLGKNGAGMPVVASPAFGQTSARTFMFWQENQGNSVWWLRWYTSSGDTGTWGLYNLSGTLTLRCRKGGANTNTSVAAPGSGWHHYAGTYDGTNARLYVDGVLVATSAAVAAPLDTAERIDLAEGTLANFVMDDLRIFDEALDQATVAELMNTPVTSGPGDITGAGVLTSASASVLGAGAVRIAGLGAATSPVGEAVGSASVLVSASGLALVAAAETSGSGAAVSAGVGSGTAPVPSVTGAGKVLVSATGSLLAPPSVVSGSDAAVSVPPPQRTFEVVAATRVFEVPAESRRWEVS